MYTLRWRVLVARVLIVFTILLFKLKMPGMEWQNAFAHQKHFQH